MIEMGLGGCADGLEVPGRAERVVESGPADPAERASEAEGWAAAGSRSSRARWDHVSTEGRMSVASAAERVRVGRDVSSSIHGVGAVGGLREGLGEDA